MYKIMAKLLNGETLELIGFRLVDVKSESVKYFGVDDVVKLITDGRVVNAKLNSTGKYLRHRLKVNNSKLENLPNYYAVGGSKFLTYEEYSKIGTYAEKVEQCIKQLEEEKNREVAEFKARGTVVEDREQQAIQQELDIKDNKVYVGIRRLDYKDGDTKISLRLYSDSNFSFILNKIESIGYERADDWRLDRNNIDFQYLDLYNLTTGEARKVIEMFGSDYCTVFENDSEKYFLANVKVDDRVYLGRVHLPENELVLISDDIISDSVITTIKGLVKTIIACFNFIDKF